MFRVRVLNQECTTTVITTRTPITHLARNPNHNPVITEYSQSRELHATRKSMEHHSTTLVSAAIAACVQTLDSRLTTFLICVGVWLLLVVTCSKPILFCSAFARDFSGVNRHG